jgi:hypothetical protein
MKRTFAFVALALLLTSSAVRAAERAGDAALGAVSGALVFGPIGAVAGAVVGYTAGPGISHSWGVRRSGAPRKGRTFVKQDARAPVTDDQSAPGNQAGAPVSAQVPPSRAAASVTPPVQGFE